LNSIHYLLRYNKMNLSSFIEEENIIAEFRDLIDSNSDEAETIDTGIDKSDVIDIHTRVPSKQRGKS
jgi:hypothetical protein